ncbi:uncharacterized protein LOC122373501 [Amphibalanus amphitrite]|uniref:uncharacterized protein LOC122373501 n=1 Tax=Amphibalanus amphitrite TaxID=1232801 RepID=UPI001C91F8CA|nr:uncharacterized protein LOC122373501 [Amphibalanus amphitrite]
MAKVLRSIMGRRDKSAPTPAVSAEPEDADGRQQGDGRNMERRVSISRSGRYKQRDKRRSGIWDNPQLVHDNGSTAGHAAPHGAPAAPPAVPPAAPPTNDKENSDAGSVRSKDSVRSRCSSVLLDTSQVTQELLDLAEQQLTREQAVRAVTVTNL